MPECTIQLQCMHKNFWKIRASHCLDEGIIFISTMHINSVMTERLAQMQSPGTWELPSVMFRNCVFGYLEVAHFATASFLFTFCQSVVRSLVVEGYSTNFNLTKSFHWNPSTMSLFGNDDHARRLQRARLQYENLLMHAGDDLIDKDAADANNSFSSETYESAYRAHSPVRPSFRGNCPHYITVNCTHVTVLHLPSQMNQPDSRQQFISPGFDRSIPHLNDSLYDEIPLTDKDKDGIIVSLQVRCNIPPLCSTCSFLTPTPGFLSPTTGRD